MSLSVATRRNILDYILLRGLPFHGRLHLITFLKRVWDLSSMSAADGASGTAEDEVRQHMLNARDWSDAELIYEYLNLLYCPEGVFLSFLTECVHPVVSGDGEDAARLVAALNDYLLRDGYSLVATSEVAGRRVYTAVSVGGAGDTRDAGADAPPGVAAAAMLECPSCRHALRPAAKFCDECGASLESEMATTQVFEGEAPSAPADSLLGRTIQSKYEILEQIGVGGMGRVYRARRRHIGDEVVIKLLDKRYVADAEAAERFRREARAAARIRHQNVVVIHDVGEAENEDAPAFIVMEWVRGKSLKAILKDEGRLDAGRAASIMREVCKGIGAGHRLGVIHRDIKPDNIIVRTDDEGGESVKVVDFGLAKLRDEGSAPSLTSAGIVMGTPFYMSPEQCRGEELSTRSDVYSLGVVAYEVLTGRAPFGGDNFRSVCAQHEQAAPQPFPDDLRIPVAIEAVVMRSLAKNPDDRYEDAEALSRELQAAAAATQAAAEAAGVAPTLDDAAAATAADARPSNESGTPGLTNAEGLVLAWSCEKAAERGASDGVEVTYVLERASAEGAGKADALGALEKLLERGCVVARARRDSRPHFERFAVTARGFDEYANAFVSDYGRIKSEVIGAVARGEYDNNLSIAESVNGPRAMIDNILDLLSNNGLIRVSRRLGGRLVIREVSPELLQRVDASAGEAGGERRA